MNLAEKQSHVALLKDALKRSEREAKGWRRIGMPKFLLDLHAEDDNKLREMIAQLEKEIEDEQKDNSTT